MQKILVIAGTTHRASINLALASHAAARIENTEITHLDLNDFEMPIYSEDREAEAGIPAAAGNFLASIRAADGIVLSLAEHNGAYSAAFKNVLDWTSRIEHQLWSNKPMLLMATSPGARGGTNVLDMAKSYFPRLGARVAETFSLPSFFDHFSEEHGITDPNLALKLEAALSTFRKSLFS